MAGLDDIETARLVATLSYASFGDLWQPLRSGSTPVTAVVAALPLDACDEVHRRLAEGLFGKSRDGSCSLKAEAFAVRGRVGAGRRATGSGPPFPPPDVPATRRRDPAVGALDVRDAETRRYGR